MKKTCLLFSLAALMLAGCTKSTTNNNTTVIAPLPAFTVNGIHDVSIRNSDFGSFATNSYLPLTIQYNDSTQETVTLSLSALPAGVTMDTTWATTGIPTFSTTLQFFDTTAAGATPGSYPMTLTATGSASAKRTYTFMLRILPAQSCTEYIVGKYNNCNTGCGGFYADSVYADPGVPNKIWFVNFSKSGNKIYGNYICSSEQLTIPSQTVVGVTYSGNGTASGSSSSHFISLNITEVVASGTNTCSISMN